MFSTHTTLLHHADCSMISHHCFVPRVDQALIVDLGEPLPFRVVYLLLFLLEQSLFFVRRKFCIFLLTLYFCYEQQLQHRLICDLGETLCSFILPSLFNFYIYSLFFVFFSSCNRLYFLLASYDINLLTRGMLEDVIITRVFGS